MHTATIKIQVKTIKTILILYLVIPKVFLRMFTKKGKEFSCIIEGLFLIVSRSVEPECLL